MIIRNKKQEKEKSPKKPNTQNRKSISDAQKESQERRKTATLERRLAQKACKYYNKQI